MAPPFPVPFGKYLLTDLVAVGGMAEIYRAKIFGVGGFEKQMVVKRILPKYARNPAFVQMFVDEATVLVSLAHGNIVPVYELGEVGGDYYIAMEYAEGLTALDLLRDCYLKARPLSVAQALHAAAEVARGLGYAHARTAPDGTPLGIVHRDLNPRNIVVTPAGEVKILDFGIARSSVKKHQTGSGVIKGTPGYMAPEQVHAMSVDARTDQYGLAIVLHELLTVRRLFNARDAAEQRGLLISSPPVKPSAFRPDIPPSVDAVVMRALAERPEDRWPTTPDFEDALRAEIARLGPAVTSRALAAAVADIHAAPDADVPPIMEASPSAPDAARVEPPTRPVTGISQRPPTQVLAHNPALAWAGKIGSDAEMLALAQVMGLRSRTPQRVAAGVLVAAMAGAGAWVALHPDEAKRLVSRAQDGRRAVTGTLVVKSRPSGAAVLLDGVEAGRTNLRLDDVLLESPRTLTVRAADGQQMTRTLTAADFTGAERKLEVLFEPGAK